MSQSTMNSTKKNNVVHRRKCNYYTEIITMENATAADSSKNILS